VIILSKKEQKTVVWKKNISPLYQTKKLCLFSHFDKDDKIEKYVIYMLKALKKLGFDIIFVSTSEKLNKLYTYDLLKRYVKIIIIKKNIGYDFASWKVGLSSVQYNLYSTVLHINDSIFFPLFNPKHIFQSMKNKADFWGLNENKNKYHFILSYFWVFEKKIIKSKFYKQFWQDIYSFYDKKDILLYERDMTSLIQKNGFKTKSYVTNEMLEISLKNRYFLKKEAEKKMLLATTPYRLFWDDIILDFKAPFIKKNILLKHHLDYHISTFYYEYIIQNKTKYPLFLIQSFIRNKKIDSTKMEKLFYQDFNEFIKILEELKNSKKNIAIYGYGLIGKIVHSCLKKQIVYIKDKNNIILNKNKTVNINLICALGREKEIIDNNSNINFSVFKLNNPKKFSDNIYHLKKWLVYINFMKYKKNIFFYVSKNKYSILVKKYNPILFFTAPEEKIIFKMIHSLYEVDKKIAFHPIV